MDAPESPNGSRSTRSSATAPTIILLILLLLGSCPLQAAVLVPTNTVWTFSKGTQEASSPTNAWRLLGFNDAAWSLGSTPFYYDTGTAYIGNTVLSDMRNQYTSVFFRKRFVVTNPETVSQITLRALVDDGFAAWINGVLLTQFNVINGAYAATNLAAGNAQEPLQWFQAAVPNNPGWLQPGTNLLAVQAFNTSRTSSDFYLDLELGTVESETTPPVILAVDPPPGTVSQLERITVTFSEPVTGLGFTDLRLNGVPAVALSGSGAIYAFDFEPPPPGTINVDWDPGVAITDLALPPNPFDAASPNARWSYTLVDLTPPQIQALSPVPNATVRTLTQVVVHFTEPVVGVDPSDLRINGSPAGSVTGTGSGPYLFSFPTPLLGPVQFDWSTAHGIRDLAATPNAFAGGGWSLTLDPNYVPPTIRVNEILASYSGDLGLRDEDDELQDWIELHNAGTNSLNLAGWSLTDNPDRPDQWIFPSVVLAPGQYLLIFASGKDRRPTAPGSRLHANFKLNAAQDAVALYNAESPRQLASGFVPQFPPQRSDYSYGLENGDDAKYFATPTPGAANGTSSIVGLAPPVHANVGRGVFTRPFSLSLSTELPSAVIRYTLDGSEPSASSGLVFSSPITVDRTAILRVAAFRTGYLPSEVITHTYVFPAEVAQQPAAPPGFPSVWIDNQNRSWTADYEMDPEITQDPQYRDQVVPALTALPILSIVAHPADLFDNTTGIYPKSQNRGPAWERPASAELILPGGAQGFQIDCGVQCQGNSARDPVKIPKHALRLVFKGDYGASKLHYRMFPDSPLEEFDTLVLRADFNFSWLHWSDVQRPRGQRTRDAFMKDSMRAMGGLAAHNRYVHLYLNGLYWGIYDPTERPDGAFAASYLGGEKEEYDVVNEGQAVDGNMTAYNAMLALTDLTTPAAYDQIQQYLDLDQYIDYILLHFYVGHEDWGRNKNWYTMRRRTTGATFKYVPWDGENLLGSVNFNRVSNADTASDLHTRLLQNSEYRLRFADHVRRHCYQSGALTPNAVSDRWLARAAEVDLAIIAESARWGDYRRDVHPYSNGPYELYTRNQHWLTEQNRLLTQYFPTRTGILLSQLNAAGLYPAVAAPTFNLAEGRVAPGTPLTLTAPAGTIYATTNNLDPRIPVSGAFHPSAFPASAPLILDRTLRVKARVFSGGVWSALTEALYLVDSPAPLVRITEVMHSPAGGDPYQFIELRNCGDTPIELSYWSFSGIQFVFPPNSSLAPGQTIVLASSLSPATFQSRYPGLSVAGWFDGQLDNNGERLALRDPQQREITSVDYHNEPGWPLAANGSGSSLEIINPLGDPDDPANWIASASPGGSPGVWSPPSSLPSVRLNELFAAAPDPFAPAAVDFIELLNTGTASMNLSDWSLSDGNDPRRFVFPPGTSIAANGYLVVWSATTGAAPGIYGGFGLARTGESLALYDPQTNRVDSVTFGRQLPDRTLSRLAVPDRWTLGVPTPGQANTSTQLASPNDLVLNEWLANPFPGQPDWIEVHNRSTSLPAALEGLWFLADARSTQLHEKGFISPGGFALLLADEQPGPGHLDLRLPAAGTTLILLDPAARPIDQVILTAQPEGVSSGRLPDASLNISPFPSSPSPEASNYIPTYAGPFFNELMAWNTGAVTNAVSRDSDWLELFNPAPQSFNLASMGLSESDPTQDRWLFPASTTIPAGGYLVVWFDGTRPASTNSAGLLNTGRGLNRQGGSVFLTDPQAQVVGRLDYGPQVRNLSIGRSSGAWTLLQQPTPGAANSAPSSLASATALRINEWMTSSTDGPDWLELWNGAAQPVALVDLQLTDDPSLWSAAPYRFPSLSYIGAGGFLLLEASNRNDPGTVPFELNSAGEALLLINPAGIVLDEVYFPTQNPDTSTGRLPDGQSRLEVFASTPTPDAPNFLPLDSIVVNEVLSHTDPPLEDAIELHNPTTSPVNLAHWFLSDDPELPRKYRLPSDTIISPGGFKVVYQDDLLNGAGSLLPFNLDSAHGDSVLLAQADAAGNLSGYRALVRFGAAFNGVSFGRHPTTTGFHFVPLNTTTFGVDSPASPAEFRTGTGATNAAPHIPGVVVSEIHYHPTSPTLDPAFNEAAFEYLELLNRTALDVRLFDPLNPANTWRCAGAVEFSFPTNVSLTPGAALLVVGFDPTNSTAVTAFRSLHNVHPAVPILGPWQGRLANQGDHIQLLAPDRPQSGPGPDAGFVPYVLLESVQYSDSAPWPVAAAGFGSSLQRLDLNSYANEPTNWLAKSSTAGSPNLPPTTTNEPPVITAPPPQSITEGEVWLLTITASDPEGRALGFEWLDSPSAAAINPTNGSLLWPTTELDGPSTLDVTLRVTDSGQPPASAIISFTLTIDELNTPPSLAPVDDQILGLGQVLVLPLPASDLDLPLNQLTFNLIDAPAGMTLDPATGEISWAPPSDAAGGTFTVSAEVVDDGQPPLTDQVTFRVSVANTPPPTITLLAAVDNTVLELTFSTSAGLRYQVQSANDLPADPWVDIGSPITALDSSTTFTDPDFTSHTRRFYRILQLP